MQNKIKLLMASALVFTTLCGCQAPKEPEIAEPIPNSEGIFLQGQDLYSKLYPLKEDSIVDLADKINQIKEDYLTENNNVFYSIIPDKTYFSIAEEKIDHKEMVDILLENVKYGKYIEIGDSLTLEDYYKTDAHWKQENLMKIVEIFEKEMGFKVENNFEKVQVENYYGMYQNLWEQEIDSEIITYMTNDVTENAVVENFAKKDFNKVYDIELLQSKTPYDVFLSGPTPLTTITNDICKNGKELVIFRDSFASSIVPLMLEGYEKITLIDLRYMVNTLIPQFITFENQDVLFLQSGAIANRSSLLK